MNKIFIVFLCLLLCSWATAQTLTVNGIDYDTKSLVDNCLVVQFGANNKPSAMLYENGSLATGISAFDQLNTQNGVQRIEQLFPKSENCTMPELAGFYSVTFESPVNIETTIKSYQALMAIDLVEPVPYHPMYYTPDDPLLTSQWGLTKVEAENAWNTTTGSSEVKLAIADSGVDWDHPDLQIDIWENSLDPVDGEDNDNNGLVDDYMGWDWVTGVSGDPNEDSNTPDNDPMDFNGHGTHCAGIAAACTDNGTGVAGLGFNCKIMCLRIGWQSSDGSAYVRMDFAAQAFYYAADHGATAINCSWGSSNTSYLRTAVDYAVTNGVVVITAAGNDDNSSAPYLGTRDDAIAVAATNQNDIKADFSNYGSWVDVSAPGVNINSTYYDDTYSSLQGTSMAAPFVTGLVGLIRAAEPTLDNAEIIERIVTTADPIDDLNPDYAGLLGTGRINAFAAVAAHLLPNFELESYEVTLTEDDGDGILNPGESFNLVITLENTWADADNITAILTSNDNFTANDSTASFGDMYSGDLANNSSTPFNLTAHQDAIPQSLSVSIDMYADGTFIETIDISIEILLNQAGFPVNLGGNIESDPLIFDFDMDGENEILIGANDNYLYAFEADGSACSGWPQSVSDGLPSGAAVGDIDGDGAYEIAIAATDGNVYAWEADGSLMDGFPVDIGGTIYGGVMLADLAGNSNLEIVVGSMSNNDIYIIDYNGEEIEWSPLIGTAGWFGRGIAVDFDDSDGRQLVYPGLDSQISAWDNSGNYRSGFPVETPNPFYTSAAAGDLDGDMFWDIVAVTSQGEVYTVDDNGNIFTGFPVDLDNTITIDPIVADINGDNFQEIIIVDNSRNIHALDFDGEQLHNFPIECEKSIKSSPVVADINGDWTKDIIVGCSNGLIYAYDCNGTLLDNFPIGGENLGEVRGAPAIGDLDGDGDLEIVFGTYSADTANLMVIDYKQDANIDDYDWPNAGYDNQRRGCIPFEEMTDVNESYSLPNTYSLNQNYPNPFNAKTTISFNLPDASDVTIEVFDILGRKIDDLKSGRLAAGSHTVTWDAGEYSSGIYFYRMSTDNFTETKRCVLIK